MVVYFLCNCLVRVGVGCGCGVVCDSSCCVKVSGIMLVFCYGIVWVICVV